MAVKKLFFVAVFVASLATGMPLALAGDNQTAVKETSEPPRQAKKAEIVVDDAAGVVRFFINGKETMRLDESGLHVREGITYGGTIGDTGPSWFDDYIAEEDKAGE